MEGIILLFYIIRLNKKIFIPFWIKIILVVLISMLIYGFVIFLKTYNFIYVYKFFLRFFFLSSFLTINKILEIKWVEIFINL